MSTIVIDHDVTDAERAQLDLDALSRQVATYDVKSQLRVSAASIFIIGLDLLGLEVAV